MEGRRGSKLGADMPSWAIHKEWDAKLGIPSKVSDYMQKAIDSKGPCDKKIPMPEDFRKHTEERKLPRSRGSNFSIADLHTNLHDRAKDKVIQREDLKFLSMKGEEYVRAYYLHFILDYLEHMRFWMSETGDSIENCIAKYEKNKFVCLPETQAILTYVIDFLKRRSEEIKHALSL